MSHNHDLGRLHNPWEKFTRRDEKKHNAENDLAFRLGQPSYQLAPTSPPQPLSTRSTIEVIDLFLGFGSKSLDEPVPRQRQLLRDFLLASDPPLPSLSPSTPTTTYIDDVELRSSVGDIVLTDDRNYHEDCARKVKQTCSDCYIYSQKLTIPELCTHLQGEVSCLMHTAQEDTRLTCDRLYSETPLMVMLTEESGKLNVHYTYRTNITFAASYRTLPQPEP
jgi:hypothetical protein